MERMARSLPCAALALGALAGLLGRLGASTVVPDEGLEEKVRLAEWIVEVEVLSARPAELPDGAIETRYELSAVTPIKGVMPSIVEVRVPGGVVGSRGLHVPGLPTLAVGDRMVLFLSQRSPQNDWRLPVGLARGAYRVVGGTGRSRVVGVAPRALDGAAEVHDREAFLAAIQEEVARQAR